MKTGLSALSRRILACLCALTVLLSVVSALGESVPADEDVAAIFTRRKTTGGMVVVAKDGEIVYEYCYGFADRKAQELVTPDTYFRLASVSKLVTAVSIMKLVETGRLDLDENIGHILGDPSFEAANPHYPKISLTARMLMTHTAGIRDNGGAFDGRKPLRETLNPKKNKSKSGFLKQKPGTKYTYSNYGAGILGCLLEAVTGKRLTDAARELLFDPLGIDAAYDPHLLREPEKIVTTYKPDGNIHKTRAYRLKEPYSEQIDLDADYMDSYGGLWIKGRDLCRIGIMLCDLGVIDGQRILEEDTVREMMASQKGIGGITADSPYGLNMWRLKSLVPDRIIYGHQGIGVGVLCDLFFDPETRFVFALVTNGCNNSKDHDVGLLARQLFDLMWAFYVEGST